MFNSNFKIFVNFYPKPGNRSDLDSKALSKVDFPAPFRPTKPYLFPFAKLSSAFLISWFAPKVRSKFSIKMSPDNETVAFEVA